MDSKHKSVETRLQEIYRTEPPSALRARLLQIPDEAARRDATSAEQTHTRRRCAWRAWLSGMPWRLAAPAIAAAAAVAIVWTSATRIATDTVPPTDGLTARAEQQQAIADFVVVMSYLQASTARVNREINGELGAGLTTAFERGEQSFRDYSNKVTNGG